MSLRAQWKMLHLLHRYGKNGLPEDDLAHAGIHCHDDTIEHLANLGVVKVNAAGRYELAEATRHLLDVCVVANRVWPGEELRVDYPEAFVVMPFRMRWSKDVYERAIMPGVEAAGFRCVRGDILVRVGDLSRNLWEAITQAGVVVADVTAPNPNVFYELGLTHALGKDTFAIRQKGKRVAADIAGTHYHEYSLDNLGALKRWLAAEIRKWAQEPEVRSDGVKALEGGAKEKAPPYR